MRSFPPPPPKVEVALPLKQTVTRYLEATGNTAAVNSTTLVARVQGFIQAIKYKDGDAVKAGTVLFVIEQKPYQLALEQAQAGQSSAAADTKKAEADYKRQVDLAAKNIASQSTLDQATAAKDAAVAKQKQSRSRYRASPAQPQLYRGQSAVRRHRDLARSLLGSARRRRQPDDARHHRPARPDLCELRHQRNRRAEHPRRHQGSGASPAKI